MQNKTRAIGRGYEIYQNAADIYEWFDSSEIEGYLKEGILIKNLRDMYNKAVETNINANKFSKQLKWSIKYKYNLTDTELEACIKNHSGNQFVKINEATNEIQTEGKIEFTNNDVNDTNVNVNSINNDINRNIDIEKDKAIPSLDEIFLEDCDLPF